MIDKRFNIFWRRVSARIIDSIIIGIVIGIVNIILIELKLISRQVNLVFFIFPIYFIWYHYFYGQTIGKKIMEIKVSNLSEGHINIWQIIIREMLFLGILSIREIYKTWINPNFAKKDMVMISILGIIMLLVDLITIFVNNEKQTIHDLISRTVVAKVE